MEILYISNLCSPEKIDNLYRETGRNPGFAIQKFNRLLAEGFIKNGNSVQTLSAPPVSSDIKGLIYKWAEEKIGGIQYKYIPFINIKILRQVCLFLYTFIYVLFWGMRKKNAIMVCDMLAISINMAALLASKINGLRSVGILTDMPGMMKQDKNGNSITLKIATKANKLYLASYDYYVFLTRQMNAQVNKHYRPYIIMEGLVDSSLKYHSPSCHAKSRQVLYAGGLFDEYGIGMFVKAFMKLENKDLSLHLFGDGPSVEWIKEQSDKDPRIQFHGVKSNEEVMEFERDSILLVNPRPTHEEFTKYSFPSKNMEFMVSGTPLLTTRLPGMPDEYYEYVYLFDRETTEDYARVMRTILSKSDVELREKGRSACEWILREKNNVYQAKRILEMIN